MRHRLSPLLAFSAFTQNAAHCPRQRLCRYVSSTVETSQPNPPLNLDPSLQALLKDVDISLEQHKSKHTQAAPRRELEAFPVDTADQSISLSEDDPHDEYALRKSPAAHFGSQRVGAVIIPLELQSSINSIIFESDKHRLHHDAKRLFSDERTDNISEDAWDVKYDVKYRSRRQAERHYERDGTAFAAIALPAHFSAISSVLDHLKHRLEPNWTVDNVIEWGAGIGSGLWASSYAFQQASALLDGDEPKMANSTLTSYLGIEKRDGLARMGKRLIQDVDLGPLNFQWRRALSDEEEPRDAQPNNTLALSAFTLSSLPSAVARKTLVKEMWQSGADVIVLIDHSTKAGFESIAEAREYLLKAGRKELDDRETSSTQPRGCHVVAPCPHDGACPLHHPGSTHLICGFSQRLQRPSFIRRTKHSGVGHEDVDYSYIAIRRGPRPAAGEMKVGRLGEVGMRDNLSRAASMKSMKELKTHGEHEETPVDMVEREESTSSPLQPADMVPADPQSQTALQAALRLEAYHWPRLVFPPLKKSGHVILDSCTPEGKIMRITIPRSQGKQEYYDARKSSWGDLFPHEPKNTPQDRYQPQRAKRKGGTSATRGADIGKRSKVGLRPDTSTQEFSEFLKEKKLKSRRDRTQRLEARREKD